MIVICAITHYGLICSAPGDADFQICVRLPFDLEIFFDLGIFIDLDNCRFALVFPPRRIPFCSLPVRTTLCDFLVLACSMSFFLECKIGNPRASL